MQRSRLLFLYLTVVGHKVLQMKNITLLSFFCLINVSISLGFNFDSDSTKVNKLTEIVKITEIFERGKDFSDKLKELDAAIKLYESIKEKELIPDETLKGIGIFYLYSRKRE